MNWFHWRGTALVLQVQVQPGARQDQFAGLYGERLKIKIHAPAVDGRANSQLIEYLAECFGTAQSHVDIVQGAAARSKRVCITEVTRIPSELTALGLHEPL